jgi:hypothetical protein
MFFSTLSGRDDLWMRFHPCFISILSMAKTLALRFSLWHSVVRVKPIFANLWKNQKSLPI